MEIKTVRSEKEIISCFEVMHTLRPHLVKENFVETVSGFISRGYHLISIEENGKIIAASGYHYTEHLLWGKAIYVDDLSCLPESRKKGYARMLLDYIVNEARKNNCNQVHLDSGSNPGRYDAHRLYLRYGFNITSFHFALQL